MAPMTMQLVRPVWDILVVMIGHDWSIAEIHSDQLFV
jgi:hypothetical protein